MPQSPPARWKISSAAMCEWPDPKMCKRAPCRIVSAMAPPTLRMTGVCSAPMRAMMSLILT